MVVGQLVFFAICEAFRAGGSAVATATSEETWFTASVGELGHLFLTARDGGPDGELLGMWEWIDDQGWEPVLVDAAMKLSVDELEVLAAPATWGTERREPYEGCERRGGICDCQGRPCAVDLA